MPSNSSSWTRARAVLRAANSGSSGPSPAYLPEHRHDQPQPVGQDEADDQQPAEPGDQQADPASRRRGSAAPTSRGKITVTTNWGAQKAILATTAPSAYRPAAAWSR